MNLKTAARRLGIHYQSAYKLVRSGRLAAIRVGGAYDISEEALARFEATRAALVRMPGTHPPADAADGRDAVLRDVRRALAATTLSARGTLETAVRVLAGELGDLAVIRLLRPGRVLMPAAFHHRDPRAWSVAAALLEAAPFEVGEGMSGRVAASGAPLLVPHVPQDRARADLPPDLVGYLDTVGVYSAAIAPVTAAGSTIGTLALSRDYPGHPYNRSDLALVEQVAAACGEAVERSDRFHRAWCRRAELREAAGLLGDAGRAARSGTAILRAGPFAEILADPDGRVVAANEAAHGPAAVGEPLDCWIDGDGTTRAVRRILGGELDAHGGFGRLAGRSGHDPVLLAAVRGAGARLHAVVAVVGPSRETGGVDAGTTRIA